MNTTPIEFMAWDDNIIQAFHSLISHEDGESVYQFFNRLKEYEEEYNSKFILLQRTALRSINDEPIYNHHIVKDIRSGNLLSVDMFNYELMSWLSNYFLEIVGNRFQHPQLLELCK